MLDVDKYKRYESPELIQWKKLSFEEQKKRVEQLNKKFEDKAKVTKVSNQSIELSLFLSKEKVYSFLVEYETYMRENLGGFPIIVLLKDRADENKKRK